MTLEEYNNLTDENEIKIVQGAFARGEDPLGTAIHVSVTCVFPGDYAEPCWYPFELLSYAPVITRWYSDLPEEDHHSDWVSYVVLPH